MVEDPKALSEKDPESDSEIDSDIDSGMDTGIEKDESIESQEEKGLLTEVVQTFLIGLVICLFLRGTIAEARFIPSGSMKPTLKVDDRILVQKVTKFFGDKFKHGDIVVFYPPKVETEVYEESRLGQFIPFVPENPPAFVKRVIGLPGDTISIVQGKGVFLNGKHLDEPYVAEPPLYDRMQMDSISGVNLKGNFIRPYAGDSSSIVVPEGHLFVLGDNRNASADSHVWGFVSQERVVGKVCLVFWKKEWLKAFSR